MKLVIVESPGKVKTIAQYLGKDYKVLATYGHVRSLPSKSGSVLPEKDFLLTWDTLTKAEKSLQAIVKSVKTADTLILATDLDREGEAIAWHLLEYLKENKQCHDGLKVERISFNAITKNEIEKALAHPRQLDMNLVDAYLARLSLDYLVGFTLSPVLWRKLPGSRSAGRVQSVALRLVVEREQAIASFQSQEYWSLEGLFDQNLKAHLSVFQGKKLEKLDIVTGEQAASYQKHLLSLEYAVRDIEKKKVQRHPAAPFITSSLQQEASNKLGFSPSRTMQWAQKLYEGIEIQGKTVGLITYMRTDSVMITPEAIQESRHFIQNTWGVKYLAPQVRVYKSKNRSQEAHEAIRPTQFKLTPENLKSALPDDAWLLYKLIWERALASQMSSAQYEQSAVIVASTKEESIFRATGSVLLFDGFLKLYRDTEEANHDVLSALPTVGQTLTLSDLQTEQHFTQPPARFSEASLVKELEDLGIGRPSTYARILQVLQEREYVALEKRRLHPTERGKVVSAFLRKFFQRYVDYHFTADLENQLDQVCVNAKGWKNLLHEFWTPFIQTVELSHPLKVSEVLELIAPDILTDQNQECPKCQEGVLTLKLGKTGPYLTCARYPDCTYSGDLGEREGQVVPQSLGKHPETKQDVMLRKGPYGWYLEHDGARTSLAPSFPPETLTLEQALWLLSLPQSLGAHPDTGQEIMMNIGRFGPYVKYEGQFYSLRKLAPETLTLEQALQVIADARKKPASTKRKSVKKTVTKERVKKARESTAAPKERKPPSGRRSSGKA